MANAYSNLKPAWHIDRIAQLRERKDIVPTHVQLIISDLCNQDCGFCAYRSSLGFSSEKFADQTGNRNPARFIPTIKAKEIIDDCAELGVKAIQFTGGGEPTVHKDHAEIIRHAQELGLSTALVTNGTRISNSSEFRNLDWLRISLDAGTEDTYERVRKSKLWSKALKGIETAAKFKKPYVGVGFVVTEDNFTDIQKAATIARDFGAKYIRFSAVFSKAGSEPYRKDYYLIKELISTARAVLEDQSFKVVDLFGDRIEDLDQGAPNYSFCGFQQFTLYIGGNQKVYTCCTNSYTSLGEIGDLKDTRLADWIKTHKRYSFNAKRCHTCQYNRVNQTINYLLDERPTHVDFV